VEGLILRLTHTGQSSGSVLVPDVEDGTRQPYTLPRPGGVYVPENGSVDLSFSSTVALSFENGAIRGLIDEGFLTARFWPGDAYMADLLQDTWALDITGKGVGASKTTTVRDGAVLAEEFGVSEEVFTHWRIRSYIDRTRDLVLRLHCYLPTSEVGKVVSFEVDVGASDGQPVNTILGTFSETDVAVSDQWLDFHLDIVIDAATVMPGGDEDALQFNIRRIASADDPLADVRVHLATLRVAD
jgi:hypothetical protein